MLTADDFSNTWLINHPGCYDLYPHHDKNGLVFLWSESCEGPPPQIAPASRVVDSYGHMIEVAIPQVIPTNPGQPAVPPPPPPSPPLYSTVSKPPSSIFTSYYGPATPSQTPPPASPPASPPTAPPANPPVSPPASPPAGPPPFFEQVFHPPYPVPVTIPTPPITLPPVLPITFPTVPTPPVTVPIEATPPTFTEPSPPRPRSRWVELGVTLLMLAPAILPLVLLRERKRARA